MIPPEIKWKKHNPDRHEVYDGDVFLVAVEVHNSMTKKIGQRILLKMSQSQEWEFGIVQNVSMARLPPSTRILNRMRRVISVRRLHHVSAYGSVCYSHGLHCVVS